MGFRGRRRGWLASIVFISFVAAFGLSLSANAQSLSGVVMEGTGSEAAPAPHVAVILDETSPVPLPARDVRLQEKWMSYIPKVQVVPPGSALWPLNGDEDTHTAHAHMGGQTIFDLASVPGEALQKVTLARAGVVTITCDIHREMKAFVLVDPARYSGVTDGQGYFHIEGVPPGHYGVRVWRPGDRDPVGTERLGLPMGSVDIPRALPLSIALPIRAIAPEEAQASATPKTQGIPVPDGLFDRLLRRVSHGHRRAFPEGRLAIIFATVLCLLFGHWLALVNYRIAAARGWWKGSAMLIGCGLALVSGLLIVIGLHGAVAGALGFGVFMGTVIFGAADTV